MKCPNCESAMLKEAKHCSECGAKNPAFDNSSARIDRLEAETKELKKKLEDKNKKDELKEEDI